MPTTTIAIIVAGSLVLLLIAAAIIIYNQLIKGRILTQEATAGIGACLQQRNDLIPSLVNVVRGYMAHENNTLVEVTRWRNQSAVATTVAEQNVASKGLNQALNGLLAVVENYPTLKADIHFQELMTQLTAIENKINDARRYYNGTIRNYNQDLGVFPKNLLASAFGFKPGIFFAEDVDARYVPKIDFK